MDTLREAARKAHVGEARAIVVAIEHVEIVREVGDVDIVAAVVVVVADGDAHVRLGAPVAIERGARRVAHVSRRPPPALR